MNLAAATPKTVLFLAVWFGLTTTTFSYDNNCPLLKLPSGRVRYRFRTKIVRFNCMRGYQLVGAKYASCMNGMWDAPTPVCVRQGCRAPSRIHVNGQFIESYRGAVVKIICNPGYSLMGSPSVYCNGIRWNETFPVCKVTNKNPALSCDFETESLCGWGQDPMQDFDWKRIDLKSLPPGEIGNPEFDHTTRKGSFMFIGSFEPRTENETTRLFSPVYPPETSYESCFKFWYYMSEGNTDVLKIYIKPEGIELYDVIPSFWTYGNQGKDWVQGFFPIYPMEDQFQIVIEGTKGAFYTSDTSFDDVKIAFGDECQVLESTTASEYFTTDEQTDEEDEKYSVTSCKYRCDGNFVLPSTSTVLNEISNEKSNRKKCECQEQCIQTKSCCTDYLSVCKSFVLTTAEDGITQSGLNVSNSLPREPKMKVSESSSSFSSPPNDFNRQNNEIDPNEPIVDKIRTRFTEKSVILPRFGQTNATEGNERTTSATTSSAIVKMAENVSENVSAAVASQTDLPKLNEKEKFNSTNDSNVVPPKKTESDKTTTKSIAIATNVRPNPSRVHSNSTYLRPRPDPGSAVTARSKSEKPFRKNGLLPANTIPKIENRNGKNDQIKSLKNSSMVAPVAKTTTTTTTTKTTTTKTTTMKKTTTTTATTTTISSTTTTTAKFKKGKFPLNSRLLKKFGVSPPSNKTNDSEVKQKGISGKEPLQAVKMEGGADGGEKRNFRTIVEIAGTCLALLVVTAVVGIVFYRKTKNRKFERNNLVEDSDSIVCDFDSQSSLSSEYHSLICIRPGALTQTNSK